MKDINIKSYLVFCIISSIIFVAAIPGTAIGWSNNMLALAIPSTVFLGLGFYSVPILWVMLMPRINKKKILILIREDNILLIKDISLSSGIPLKETISLIRKLISDRYLVKYQISEDKLRLITPKEYENRTKLVCPYCGGEVYSTIGKCNNCGAAYKIAH